MSSITRMTKISAARRSHFPDASICDPRPAFMRSCFRIQSVSAFLRLEIEMPKALSPASSQEIVCLGEVHKPQSTAKRKERDDGEDRKEKREEERGKGGTTLAVPVETKFSAATKERLSGALKRQKRLEDVQSGKATASRKEMEAEREKGKEMDRSRVTERMVRSWLVWAYLGPRC